MNVVTLALEVGAETEFTVAVDGQTAAGRLDVLDLGEWLDRLVRSAHRSGRRVRAVVVEPEPGCDLMAEVARRTVRRVFGVYDAVKVEWK